MDGPPPPDTNNAPKYVIVAGILVLIAVLLNSTRIITKLRSFLVLRIDDYTITIATVLSVAGYCSAIGAAANGWGHVSFYVPETDQTVALKCIFAVQFIWILTIWLIRTSVALSLLRLSMNPWWRGSLYALIVIQALLSTGWLIVQFAWCRPLRSSWENVPDKQCWDFQYQINFGWITSGIFVAMDLVLALMPIKLIWKLQRPTRERILIACLMALGLTATAMAGAKMTTFNEVGKVDPLSTTYSSLLAKMEEVMGIIASCTLCLKSPIERLLRHIGILSDRGDSMSRPSFVISSSRDSPRIALSRVEGSKSSDEHGERGKSRGSSVMRGVGMDDSASGARRGRYMDRGRKGWDPV